jgi:Na+-transporting NADH:ubiquinone oxidoreductase subunit NqrB
LNIFLGFGAFARLNYVGDKSLMMLFAQVSRWMDEFTDNQVNLTSALSIPRDATAVTTQPDVSWRIAITFFRAILASPRIPIRRGDAVEWILSVIIMELMG